MNLRPAGLGAEPKKIIMLVGVVLLGGGVVYWANQSDVPAGASTSPAPAAKTAAAPVTSPPKSTQATVSYGPRTASRGGRGSSSGDDFRPTLKVPDGLDLTRVDPTLKTDLLAKVRQVSIEGGSRSLFEFYTPPPPPVPVPKPQPIVPKPVQAADSKAGSNGTPGISATPPPPRIPLKFYGYSGNLRSATRRAFFLDGEDIVQAGENDTIRNRYKIIRIGVNSAEVEDTVAKNKQTLPLTEEAQ